MGSLKRKERPAAAAPASKSPKPASDARPSKRTKSSESAKDEGKKKTTKKDDDSKPVTAQVVSHLKEEEPLFPRGGGSVLTPLEHKQIQIQAKQDVLFEQESSKAKKGEKGTKDSKKQKRKSKGDETSTKATRDEDSVKIESLNFKRLVKGSLVLGQVASISALELAVALPNNLIGHVPITAISDTLTQRLQTQADEDGDEDMDEDENDVDLESIFEIGQYVRAYVMSTIDESAEKPGRGKGRRHIELSLQPQLANSEMSDQDVVTNAMLMASVSSVEDHGFVMDIGVSGLKAFLPKKQVEKGVPLERLQPGSVLLCAATGKRASVVQLSALRETIGSTSRTPAEATAIGTFLPGTLADILVSDVSDHGIVGKVMGHLDVTADLVHSGAGPDGVDLEEKYKVGSRLKARIICNFPTAKAPKLGISILPHVLSLSSKMANLDGQPALPQTVLPYSVKVECTVRSVEADIGLYVDVGVDGVPGFVHISRVKDGKIDALFKNSGPYQAGSVHQGRVVGYDTFDGYYLISMEQSVLEQPFLRIEDIPVGAVVPGTVEKLVVNSDGLGGVIVNISEGISGLVPEMHLADVHLQHPEKKFREGMKVKTRVLSTNPAMHQVRLTLKKTLVNSEQPAIKSYDELAVGLQAPGTIIKVLEHGAIVQFYGSLRGFLPVSEMSEAYIKDPREHFRVGQVVSIYVISFDPEASKLIVSCKDPSAFGLEKQVALQKLKIGDLVSAKVTQKTEDDIFVELTEGSLKAILPVPHLTDKSASKTQSALKKIHVGLVLTELVVLEKNESRRAITLSHKPSLVKAAQEGRLLAALEDARAGEQRQGFVCNIIPTGVFVQFAAKLQALLPKSLLPKDSQSLPDFGLHKFQPLTVEIITANADQKRLIVAIPGASVGKITKSEKPADAVVSSLDPSIRSMDDITVGKITKARIASVKGSQLNVRLADNVQGRVDVSNVFDSWDEIQDPKEPLKPFKAKQIITVRVLGVHDARNHRFLPITHRSQHSVLELSMKPSDLEEGDLPEPLSFSKVKKDANYIGFVNNIARNYIWISLSTNVRGRLDIMEASDDLTQLNEISESFPIGSALKVRVVSVDAEKERLDFSARSPDSKKDLTWDTIQQNMVLAGKISKVTDRQIVVKLSETLGGPVHLADLADDFDEANPLKYRTGDYVRVAVAGLDKPNKRIRLSTRPSRVLNSSLPVKDREISKSSKIEVGEIIRGHVKNVSDKGLFISLGGDVVAMSKVKNLSDSFLKDWKDHFQVDQVVKGRVISVADGRIEMSLKPSVLDKDFVPLLTIDDLKEGQIVTGKVRKVEEFGAFIDIDGSDNISGLCHRSEMADKTVQDAKTLYNTGDKVKAIILKIDKNAKKINFGLKPSYFDDEDHMDVDDDDAGAALDSDRDEESDSDAEMSDDGGAVVITGTDNVESDSEDDDEDGDVEMTEPEVKGLDVGGFDWSAGSLEVKKKVTTAVPETTEKKTSRREPQITVDKTAELDVNGPQTASDYERLLLGQPDSSQLWIAYMAFQMQVSELASARKVAERALKTINMREQTEKLNVWIAYLNLEVAYGTDESVEDVFKRACSYNDEEEVHKALASIYIQSQRRREAKELFEKMLKKFGAKSVDVWVNYAQFLHATAQEPENARALLKRATQRLGSDKHLYLALVPRFAALEFRSPNGDRDQGRTLFESLLATYPKRFDLWNQLMDLETSSAGAADPVVVRDLFDRGSKVKSLSPKQAEKWFRRWSQWEEEHGDKKSKENVKTRAKAWAQAHGEKKAAKEKGGEESDE
ncbi:rRNA biogenesis protein rrp5 [Rhypophila sp. PSN 637]